MLLDILFLKDAEGHERRRISLTDITEFNRAQKELRIYKEELEELVGERTAELLQANEQLREANDNLEALFRGQPPLAIAVFDAKGKVTNINPAAERLYGWTLQESRVACPCPSPGCPRGVPGSVAAGPGESVTGLEIRKQRKTA